MKLAIHIKFQHNSPYYVIKYFLPTAPVTPKNIYKTYNMANHPLCPLSPWEPKKTNLHQCKHKFSVLICKNGMIEPHQSPLLVSHFVLAMITGYSVPGKCFYDCRLSSMCNRQTIDGLTEVTELAYWWHMWTAILHTTLWPKITGTLFVRLNFIYAVTSSNIERTYFTF